MSARANPPLSTRTRTLARDLRRAGTDAELRLWRDLRGSRLAGYKFRRQHPVPPYIADFYCDAARLVIELDGSQHCETGDAARTRFFERKGIAVLRFWDNDVLNDTAAVLASILASLQSRTLTPTPLPMGEGLQAPAAAKGI